MKIVSKCIAFGSMLAMCGIPAFAQNDNLGKREFEANCAICHGVSGKGDGPLAGYLTEKAADLTTLTEKHNGVFPFSLLQALIDGREITAIHGTRDMPVWGTEYDQKAIAYYSDYFGAYSSESFVRARVLALVEYIHSLQKK